MIVIPTCPQCGVRDYMPLGGGWRRCWGCRKRWGPEGTPDPGDPADIERVRELVGLAWWRT